MTLVFLQSTALYEGDTPHEHTPEHIHRLLLRHAELAKYYAHGRPGLLKMRTLCHAMYVIWRVLVPFRSILLHAE